MRHRVIFLLSLVATAAAAAEVRLLTLEGALNPITARYLSRELQSAAEARAELVVIRLDTPGGLDHSMREMSQAILTSPVPVVVYVSPSGARAASAGMFLTISAHVAAMAPGTTIGAAHPVGLGQGADQLQLDKATADSAALARSIAQQRGRNASWVERSVRESVAISAQEAHAEHVIDLVAEDLPSLLRELEGRALGTSSGQHTLELAAARLEERKLTGPERLLHAITDPNIAYLLLMLGLLGVGVELMSPGVLLPGVAGGVSLILAFVALGSLPINWAGLVLILSAAGLFAAEFYTPGGGSLGAGGVVSFILGSLLLYRPSVAMPEARVSPGLIAVLGTLLAFTLLFLVRALIRARGLAVSTGIEGLLGSTGVATSELSPRGTVELNREAWNALAVDEPIHRGDTVKVTGVEGVTLQVKRQPLPARS